MKPWYRLMSAALCVALVGCSTASKHKNFVVSAPTTQKSEPTVDSVLNKNPQSPTVVKPREVVANVDAEKLVADLTGEPLVSGSSSQPTDLPKCARKLGTITIVDGDDPKGWAELGLAPPQKLIRALVLRSGCFNIVDRGIGLNAASLERDISHPVNIGRGLMRIREADYVLVAEFRSSEPTIGAGDLHGKVGSPIGGLAGGVRATKVEANTLLSLINLITTETVAVQDGFAVTLHPKLGADSPFSVGFKGISGVGGGYETTEVGRVAILSFIQAYSKLVKRLDGDPASGTAEIPQTKGFTIAAPTALRQAATTDGRVIRQLPAGAPVYPTGNKRGNYREVADATDHVGWVLGPKISDDTNQVWLSSTDTPLLPWPPPRASAIGDFTSNFKTSAKLGEYNAQLRSLLIQRGYVNLHYFAVPNGFGITTDVERLNESGAPSKNRWTKNAPPPENFLDYLSKLMRGDTGHYRVLVFIISNKEPFPANDTVNQKDLARWKENGKPALSSMTTNHAAEMGTKVWLLVYEFVNSNSKSGELVAVNDGGFPLVLHAKFLGLR